MPVTDPELQTGTVDRPSPWTSPTPATAANSTTLAQLEAKKARAKLVIGALVTLAGMLLMMPAAFPAASVAVTAVFVGVAIALFIGAIAVAYFTNSLTPAEIDDLLRQVANASRRLEPTASSSPSDGPAGGVTKRGPPEP